MSNLRPLHARDRYTDDEWALASVGLCDWEITNYPTVRRCLKPSSPNSFYRYCGHHDERARDDMPDTYGE